MNDLISVIIPSYNRFSYLQNAITSVINQTYKNFEIIIINDGSDQSQYYENNFPDCVKLIHQKINHREKIGYVSDGYVRNIGINEANGDYLAFLDDDDIWLPDKLDKQISAIKESQIEFSSTEGFYGKGPYINNLEYPLYNQETFFNTVSDVYKNTEFSQRNYKNIFKKSFKYPKVWTYEFLKIHNCIIASSVMVKKSLLDTLGGFRAIPITKGPDYDCWLGLLQLSDLIYVNEPLFYYDGGHGDGQDW